MSDSVDVQHKNHAVFRLPGKKECEFISGSLSSKLTPLNFGSQDPAFVFSPFNNADEAYAILPETRRTFGINEAFDFNPLFGSNDYNTDSKEDYITKVAYAVNAFHNGDDLKKVVLARAKKIVLDGNIELNKFFVTLCRQYPNAFVYMLSSEIFGTWIGATPELLLSVAGNEFSTVALAGTLPSSTEIPWGLKEIIEQHIVEEHIESLFRHFSISHSKSGPDSAISGDLKHLKTIYRGAKPMGKDNFYNEFLRGLNPTPAICGFPKLQAQEYIKLNENLNRSLYSGIIGVAGNNKANLFVNLRCMELQQNQAYLFAGAGIVKDSVNELEWDETERKMWALQQFLDCETVT